MNIILKMQTPAENVGFGLELLPIYADTGLNTDKLSGQDTENKALVLSSKALPTYIS